MIEERDNACYILPPPASCPKCNSLGSVAIGHNEYYEGHGSYTTVERHTYIELFHKCLACGARLETAPISEVQIFNSYPPDKQMWPKAMQHKLVKGKMIK